MQDVEIKIEKHEFFNMITDSLTQEQGLQLITEIDESWSSWDFTHKLFMYVRNVIKKDPKDYKQFLEDMTDLPGPTIISIMDELDKKLFIESDLVEDK
jgi:hypothetical protein